VNPETQRVSYEKVQIAENPIPDLTLTLSKPPLFSTNGHSASRTPSPQISLPFDQKSKPIQPPRKLPKLSHTIQPSTFQKELYPNATLLSKDVVIKQKTLTGALAMALPKVHSSHTSHTNLITITSALSPPPPVKENSHFIKRENTLKKNSDAANTADTPQNRENGSVPRRQKRLPRLPSLATNPASQRNGSMSPQMNKNPNNNSVSNHNTSMNDQTKVLAPSHIFYFYSLTRGNNHQMIERILANRSWWKNFRDKEAHAIADKTLRAKNFDDGAKQPTSNNFGYQPHVQAQLYWKMGNTRFDYDKLKVGADRYTLRKCANRFPRSDEIGDKDNMFRNLWFMCQSVKTINLFDVVPVTFSFRMNEAQFLKDIQTFCRYFKSLEQNCSPEEVVPLRTVRDEKSSEDVEIFYEFGSEITFDGSYRDRKFNNANIITLPKNEHFYQGHNMWIMKPSGCDRGQGVEIFKTLDELNKFLTLFTKGYTVAEYVDMDYNDEDDASPALKGGAQAPKAKIEVFPKFVIQKYMELPALFKGYKFDIRAHALLSQDLTLYVFRDSYVRVSSLPYDLSKRNYFAHLCNTSVNMRSQSFGKIAVGNTISVGELSQFFDEKEATNSNCSIKNFEEYFWEEIKRLVKITFDAIFNRINLLNPNKIPNCFELFGFDIMVDESYRCWLIEANFIPGLTDEDNSYLKAYLDRMMDDMFKLTVDEMYRMPRQGKRAVNHYPFLNFPNEENLWHKIGKYS